MSTTDKVIDHLDRLLMGINGTYVLLIAFAIIVAVIIRANVRHYYRRREVAPGVFVVGSLRSGGSDLYQLISNAGRLPDPFEIGKANPIHGGVTDGSPQDYVVPVSRQLFDD